ncbi:hypothetical protein SH584_01140 [Sphingomonas sp. LY29]|uniref:hypothetical protein n=1 Tax=Sphingomonas sp. LY29 TaxID=3095341 RepID=UPI002D79D20D|nr:hypothetical protein [Sphingomonas sp. LY29]WRP26084.1 hypothetical protein SH584_01140 [Sphingomonas sp. LY29]
MRDLDLVRHYWPVELRPAFDALMGIDDAMADVVMTSTQPALGAIRLAWWREALERLDTSPPPPEPRLKAVADELLPRGISGKMLGSIEEGWAAAFEEMPDPRAIRVRGERLFAVGAKLLGCDDPDLAEAGGIFALGDATRRGILPIPAAHDVISARYPTKLRPLTALARLGLRDLRNGRDVEPEATPGRAAALLSHRLFGTIG